MITLCKSINILLLTFSLQSVNLNLDIDKREAGSPLTNGAVYTACAGIFVNIGQLGAVTGWPHLVRTEESVPIIGQAIFDALNHVAFDPNSGVLGGLANAGLSGGTFLFQLTPGASTRRFIPVSLAPILHDAVARMYVDARGGITFNILDEVARVIFKVVLIKVSNDIVT